MRIGRALRSIGVIAVVILLLAFGLWAGRPDQGSVFASAFDSSSSPYAAAADFARYTMKLHEQGVLRTTPIVGMPVSFRSAWKQNIVTTVFWVGELASVNNPVSNDKSSWDLSWIANYGGFDPPETSNRRNYLPVAFIPRLNPFYVALPYNDLINGQFKPEASL